MRTVVENRYGISRTLEHQNVRYAHLNQSPRQTRSCFYDFGEKKQVKFVESADCEESEFIESLMTQFCG